MPRGRKRKSSTKKCQDSQDASDVEKEDGSSSSDIVESAGGVAVGDPLPYSTTPPTSGYFTLPSIVSENVDGLAGAVDRESREYRKDGTIQVVFALKYPESEPPTCDVDVAKGYFQSILRRREVFGYYSVCKVTTWNGLWTTYYFNNSSTCPLCHEVHDSYAFQYRVKKGCYGGWRCWKTNRWETDFHADMLHLMMGKPYVAGPTDE